MAGVKAGDEVIVPTITFIAPVNAIQYNGATPVFMDTDSYYNLDVEKTVQFIHKETVCKDGFAYNKKTGKKLCAIVPVHVWGNAAWLDELIPVCHERNIAIVEDASESLGTRYIHGNYAGKHSGTIGMLGCLSFNGNKIITSGGGGMILTNDEEQAERAQYLTTQAKDDPVRYIHDEVGYNFRLTNIQAALGVGQLEQLSGFLKQKKEIFEQYLAGVTEISGLSIAPVPEYAENNHWLNILRIEPEVYGRDRDSLMADFEKKGIQTRPVWHLNHLQKPYRGCQTYKIARAEKLLDTSLCLPSSSQMTKRDVSRVIDCLYG